MNNSYVEIDSQLLAKACEFGIKSINEMVRLEVESAIDDLMSKRFFRPKSRKNALRELKVNYDFGLVLPDYDLIVLGFSGLKDLCNNLLGMSQLSDKVFLSREDYRKIKKYILGGIE